MAQGFSADGYIIDQNAFRAYPYRTITSDINGCGWIAAFNLRRALGQAVEFDAVRAEMDGLFTLRVPGPTTMRAMRRYLRAYVPECRFAAGDAAARAARESRAGILRYRESGIPHFVTYLRLPEGRCRFFNVADGLEDFTEEMDVFLSSRCSRGLLRVMAVE